MIPFTKMSGTGNDFIVLDNREGRWTGREKDFFASVCRRRFSAGADGVILAQKGEHAPVRMRYFNSDGGEAAMCANGARCTAFYGRNRGFTKEDFFLLEAADGLHEVEVTGAKVKLEMRRPRDFRSGFGFVHQFGIREGGFLDTGVPHLVLFMDGALELKNLDVNAQAPYYRNHRFFDAGANVNFVQRISPGAIQVRTFERGVEGETLSCGTGCVASALIASRTFGASSPISVRTPGGELEVEFDRDWSNVFLTGAVRMVYEGSLYPEAEGPR
jgi:diaminopimelate epimerase